MHSVMLVFFLAASTPGAASNQSDAAYHHVLSRRALDIPSSINGYNYIGCYTDVGRTIDLKSKVDGAMTNAECVAFCQREGGYYYAGTEFMTECWCGNRLNPLAEVVVDEECSTQCGGNAQEACGGPDRLTLYMTDPPKEVPSVGNWNSLGCWTDSPAARALSFDAESAHGQTLTVQSCTSTCEAAGFLYAGVEYSGECYCGNAIENGNVKAADQTSCDMPCYGDRTQLCGGRGFINIYTFTAPPASSATTDTGTTASSTSSFECSGISSSDPTDPTTLDPCIATTSGSPSTTSVPASSPNTCTCSILSSVALGKRDACDCSPRSASETPASPPSSTPASVSTSGYNSGPDSEVLSMTSTLTSSLSDPVSTACPYQPASIGPWTSIGCYTEATSGRALTGAFYGSPTAMTIEACAEFCEGYTYFGVEWSQECFCGNKLNAGSKLTDESECDMVCSGEECNYCGAGNRLSVYTVGDGPSPPDPSSTTNPTSVRGPDPSSVPSDLPEGWDYYGCWVDAVNGRILNYQWTPNQADLTQESCVAHCEGEGYTIAGLEYYTECYCGKQIVNGGKLADKESECSTPCGGNSNQSCGGPGRMSIFSRGEPAIFGPPAPVPSVGDWTYKGCAQDNVQNKRTFPWQLIFNDMTPKKCLDACQEFGYAAAGIEYGVECYCGDPQNMVTRGAEFVDNESECNMACPGNETNICGGPARLTTYFWEGDPLYEWDFPDPDTAAAGAYEFLIGGVVIPLMTSQAVNGKVTFLEKWGTGPPNSTGAYELDLSEIDDFSKAWRTMHVQTDLFCAAGVTLPDKAGRQLTVGGWAGDATFGVRLYTPDGSPGVKGTNDWEENVDALKLQNGRWYPSTLNMANGSVLVIGGEDGSNGAPVPTLEILPFTGTAPLYMDWLERTDPNNLYPFLCVLPSGGIFVAYWNEARILDEKTFATTKTLPNMPGAVNDPLGGRTYPLEGTAVLLPQYAPYDDPLGVLICGGSTEGVANALDNCVSIQPDKPGAEWTIERMPSKRVISCMAPLPDGTYLVLNGAQQGVAGFGLATNPNLNALLYDPKKEVHKRFSVMANTTVARMYHSEAITLLDGRVLVSGSDPQDNVHPQEYRIEVFQPPYLLSGKPRPTFTLNNKDWSFGQTVSFALGGAAKNGAISVSLLGSVSSTHGNSMGARTLFPAVSCSGTSCTVTAPPNAHVCPPGWYQFFVLDGGIPAVGVFVRIGGDPAELGNWPQGEDFTRPGV